MVQGTIPYDVTISNLDTFFDYSCSCPYYEKEFDLCKHIWAACLAAEQEGYLRGAEFRDVESGKSRLARPQKKAAKSLPPPSWRKQLQPLLSAMTGEEQRRRSPQPPSAN